MLSESPPQFCFSCRHFQWIQGLLWAASLGCTTLVVFCCWPWNKMRLPSRSVSAVYAALHKNAWALSLFWITFACATDRGGNQRTSLASALSRTDADGHSLDSLIPAARSLSLLLLRPLPMSPAEPVTVVVNLLSALCDEGAGKRGGIML